MPGAHPFTIRQALQVFAKGFAFTRSFTHPCVAEEIDGIWVMRDAPRKRPADYRVEEWIAFDLPATDADAAARRHARGRFCICAILPAGAPDAALRADYRQLRYRPLGTEPLMMHPLARIPRFASPFPVVRVDSPELAAAVKQSAGRTQALPEHFGKDAALRLYAAMEGARAVGWVRSIPVADASWVSTMHVLPSHRRRGIGKALLAHMLADDRRHGITTSVLLSSHTGALLYPHVGYRQMGMLYLYRPRA
jgi:GNAT superfamily N-acetyltransferase